MSDLSVYCASLRLDSAEYAAQHPECAPHMLRPDLATLRTGFILAGPGLAAHSAYPGGYLMWSIIDVRKYPASMGWISYDQPYRVYVCDYDDWSVERRFETLAEAQEAVDLLATGPITLSDLQSCGFRGT